MKNEEIRRMKNEELRMKSLKSEIVNLKSKIVILIAMMLWGCTESDKEFVHDSNTIAKLVCRATHDATPFEGIITEYDKSGTTAKDEFEQKDVEGGYGMINIEIPERFKDEIDLQNVYLYATLSWDQSIMPTLSGRHDITGDGIVVTVISGVGTKRNYRIKGFYEE